MQESFGETDKYVREVFFGGERGGGVISNPQHEEDAKIGCRTKKKGEIINIYVIDSNFSQN